MAEWIKSFFIPLEALPALYSFPSDCLPPEFDPEANISPTFAGTVQLLFIAVVYGMVLYRASLLIVDGSELLLLIPEIAPVVGSVVLPVLGAVPDGAMILFSGLGDFEKAQKQLTIGVGALAGSTIMLLTIPYFLSLVAGAVDIIDRHGKSRCNYAPSRKSFSKEKLNAKSWSKFLFRAGVEPDRNVMRKAAMTMALTCIPYVIIQGSAFAYSGDESSVAFHEKYFALGGLLICCVLLAFYLWSQISGSVSDPILADVIDRKREAALKSGLLSLQAIFFDEIGKFQPDDVLSSSQNSLLESNGKEQRFEKTVRKFFTRYDVDGNGSIDRSEFKLLLNDFRISDAEEVSKVMFSEMDKNGDNMIQFHEFVACMLQVVSGTIKHSNSANGTTRTLPLPVNRTPDNNDIDSASCDLLELLDHHENRRDDILAGIAAQQADLELQDDDDEPCEEVEDVPSDLADMSPEQQRRRILWRAFYKMFLGGFLVFLFSDPMVDVLDKTGQVFGIGSFYVSFVLSPLAANGSELIAAYQYASSKTKKTISISLNTLTGAAILNNTLCLGIFLALVFFRGLSWTFSAETISILSVELIFAWICTRKFQTVGLAFVVLSLYPLSIALVYILENVFHLD